MIRTWYHAGEAEAVVVYSSSRPRKALAILVGTFLLFLPIAVLLYFSKYFSIVYFVGPLLVLRTFADSRRVLMFGDGEVIQRPVFGRVGRTQLSEIQAVKPITSSRTFLLRPVFFPAAKLTLRSSNERIIALDVDQYEEALNRLRAAAKLNQEKNELRKYQV